MFATSASAAALVLALAPAPYSPSVADPIPDPVALEEPVELEEVMVIGAADPVNPRVVSAARFAAQETPGAVAMTDARVASTAVFWPGEGRSAFVGLRTTF